MKQWEEGWVCPTCKQARGKDGHDPCIRDLPGVQYACCGHGKHGYLYFENGVRIGIVVTSVRYDDERAGVEVASRRSSKKGRP